MDVCGHVKWIVAYISKKNVCNDFIFFFFFKERKKAIRFCSQDFNITSHALSSSEPCVFLRKSAVRLKENRKQKKIPYFIKQKSFISISYFSSSFVDGKSHSRYLKKITKNQTGKIEGDSHSALSVTKKNIWGGIKTRIIFFNDEQKKLCALYVFSSFQ